MTDQLSLEILRRLLPKRSPPPELEEATMAAIADWLDERDGAPAPGFVRALSGAPRRPSAALVSATLDAAMAARAAEAPRAPGGAVILRLDRAPDAAARGPIRRPALAASGGDELRDAGVARRPEQDWGYALRVQDDAGFLRVFVRAERDGFVGADRFHVTFSFRGGETISGGLAFPRHARGGANLGPLDGLTLDDLVEIVLRNEPPAP